MNDRNKQVIQFQDGSTMEIYTDFAGRLHGEDTPAKIQRFANGHYSRVVHAFNGIAGHHDDREQPSEAYFYPDGSVKQVEYWRGGMLHRQGGPAIIRYFPNGRIENQYFFRNGAQANGPDEWHGQRFREDGTMIECTKVLGTTVHTVWDGHRQAVEVPKPTPKEQFLYGILRLMEGKTDEQLALLMDEGFIGPDTFPTEKDMDNKEIERKLIKVVAALK